MAFQKASDCDMFAAMADVQSAHASVKRQRRAVDRTVAMLDQALVVLLLSHQPQTLADRLHWATPPPP